MPEDYDRFMVVIAAVPHALIKLNSAGGKIDSAIRIGHEVRNRKLATTVDETCQSACALIWVAGVERYLPPGTAIGFHQPFTEDGSVAIAGVARMGAYLDNLGYSDLTVTFAVSAPPKGMRWIQNAKDAAFAGITVTPTLHRDQPAFIAPWPMPSNGRQVNESRNSGTNCSFPLRSCQ